MSQPLSEACTALECELETADVRPLSGTNPLFGEPEVGILKDENDGGGRTTAQNGTSEQAQPGQKETHTGKSEHEELMSQQNSGRADNGIAIESKTDGGVKNIAKPGDVDQMQNERQFDEKGEASKQVVPGKMIVDQSLPVIIFGTHTGGKECPCEDCYKKRKIAEEAAATTVEKEEVSITAPAPNEDPSPPTPSPSPPLTPAPPSPGFGQAEANLTSIVEVDVLTAAPPPSEKPSSPPDPITLPAPTPSPPHTPTPSPPHTPTPSPPRTPTPSPPRAPTPSPLHILSPSPPHTPTPALPLASSPPPLSPPAEDTCIMITEDQDTTSEESQEEELTEEEQKKMATIVEDLYEELIEGKAGGCCRGCCHVWCWDCCGQALTVSCNDRDCKNLKGIQRPKDVFTPELKKAVGGGMKAFWRLLWPFAPALLRDVWVSLEWILGFLALVLSIVQFAVTGDGEVFNTIHLALAAFGFLLASVDALVQLSEMKSCKTGYHACCGKGDGKKEDKESDKLCFCCCKRSSRGGKALLVAKNLFDVARTLISELLLYPLLLCDLFELILCKGWEFENANDTIGFVLFLISLVALVLFVYILRALLLFIMLVRAQKTRQKAIDKAQQSSTPQALPNEQPPPYHVIDNQTTPVPENNETISRTAGKWFSGYFLVHVVSQMIAQILMIIAISAKFQYENRNYDKDKTIHISSYLWYMIIAGYILPFCGFLTFFIVNFYWAREFPIKLYIQILSILSSPDASFIFFPKETLGDKKGGHEEQDGMIAKWKEVMQHVNSIDLKNGLINDFREMTQQDFVRDKLGFPFRNPGLIILCIIYAILQLTFVICASQNDEGDDVILNGGGWTIFYICAIILGGIANTYTFLVAYLWLFVIAFIVATVLAIIAMICLCILLVGCLSSSRSQPPDRYHNY